MKICKSCRTENKDSAEICKVCDEPLDGIKSVRNRNEDSDDDDYVPDPDSRFEELTELDDEDGDDTDIGDDDFDLDY